MSWDERAVGSRLGPTQKTSSVTLGELASLDLKSLTVKQGGLAEIRDPQLAIMIPQLVLKPVLSETGFLLPLKWYEFKDRCSRPASRLGATPHFTSRSSSLPGGLRLQGNKKEVCS